MKNKILAFGASNSKNSINKKLADYASAQLQGADIDLIDLNDFEMPIFSIDREKENGIPNAAKEFREKILNADGIIISFAEHNGSYTAVFKNISDWISRLDNKIWRDKLMFIMSTSPGGRGAILVLQQAMNDFQRRGANIQANFSLPKFNDNFSVSEEILDETLKNDFNEKLSQFAVHLF